MASADAKAIESAIESCHLLELADRAITTLSGGELARVHVARALACKAPLLLADEPVTALDPRHQLAVMDLLRTMVDEGGSALVILHDLALAARFADRIIGMKAGRIVIDANCNVAMTASIIRDLFGVEAVVDYERGYPVPVIVR
jgi:iron complex transport system ATP-binding protein